MNVTRFAGGIVLVLLVAMAASGQETKEAPTKEELERIKSLDDAMAEIDRFQKKLDDNLRQRHTACLMAFGHGGFCECLNKRLPIGIGFSGYVEVVTKRKDELGYAQLSADERKVVDVTLAARETCVASVWGPAVR